jgi:hypothetical protein
MKAGAELLALTLTEWMRTPGRAEAFGAQIAQEADEAALIRGERQARIDIIETRAALSEPVHPAAAALDQFNRAVGLD